MKRARALFVVAGSLAGCSADFDNVTTVKDLRVLAVVAEPSELLVDDLAALPDEFPTVTVRPLIVDPAGPRPIAVSAVACVNAEQATERGRDRGPAGARDTLVMGPCPVEGSVPLELVAADPAPLEPNVELRFAPTRAFVAAAFASDPFSRGPLSLRATPLTIELSIAAGGESDVGRKRVIGTERPVAGQAPNANPIVPALNVRALREGPETPLDPGTPESTLRTGGRVFVNPVPAISEPYSTFELGATMPIAVDKETLRYAYYARFGSFAPAQTSSEPPRVITEPAGFIQSEYRAPAEAPPDGLDPIWVVVRDERAGQSFIRGTMRVVPRAP